MSGSPGELLGADAFRRVAEGALSLGGVDGVEVLLMHESGGLTRFANSEIHQSIAREDTGLRVRVVKDGHVGVAATNEATPEGALAAARSALEMAEVVAADPLWPGLAPSQPLPEVDRYFEGTASVSPTTRADAVAELIGRCAPGCVAAGAYETIAVELGVANSEGQLCWSPSTQASLTAVVSGPDGGSGFAEVFAGSADAIDAGSIGQTANDKAVASASPAELDAGTYTVVLEPSATATLVGFLAWVGFAGRAYIEGRSCFDGKQGQQVAAPSVSIWDDGTDPRTLGAPFDFEGTPKQRVDLISNGVFRDVVYDRRTGKEAGRSSTGHGLPSPNPEGPFPLHLFMGSGDATVDEMVRSTDRGLLVTRFHYSNIVNPMESSITGMTRDGTFLIEGGEIVGPVRNLRFTQSILGALSSVSMVGREAHLASEFFFSASRVPAVKVDEFHFSGVSDH
ncbi:MAG TPA: TldD/PmbA family protein [Actinomycetota bacterium]|nr:TldD/PmbA family protein [Actinomycetota bacterium]